MLKDNSGFGESTSQKIMTKFLKDGRNRIDQSQHSARVKPRILLQVFNCENPRTFAMEVIISTSSQKPEIGRCHTKMKKERQAQLKLSETTSTWTPADSDTTSRCHHKRIRNRQRQAASSAGKSDNDDKGFNSCLCTILKEPAQGFKTIVKGSKKTRIFSQEVQAVGTQRMLRFRKTRRNLQEGSRAIEGPAQQISQSNRTPSGHS
ncbi:hypothetical protein GCK72_010423 [Caenorhabditis remanei]|uniref:Uncharacterized protein n=1 Tax=Caenorhabditis remanei TaxID=31234 RepID=A0A6A5H5E1_CAERE|nr:hypothetical protein GCK72_010423 [Caenorhabditis remanei]KAF1762161.1 hypothetical protein GCK72_010423 [Caenorhabditis remanei]